ncbi:MAG: hypothetical protein U0237_07065 [Thermoleophilia bacterium]
MAFDPKLGAEWFFTAEDLAANNAGRLTPEQEEGFRRTAEVNRRYSRRSGKLVVLVFGAAAVVVAYAMATQPGGTEPVAILVPVGAFAAMLLLLWIFARRNRRMRTMFEEHRLASAEGVLKTWPTFSDDYSTWAAQFGDVKFEIDGIRHGVLKDGVRYRVNYLESGNQRLLLTLEPLDP